MYNSRDVVSSSKKVVKHLNVCPGQALYVPDGVSPHCVYPSLIHTIHSYPWTTESLDTLLVVQSTDCERKRTPLGEPCGACHELLKHKVIEGIEHHN